MIFDYSMGSELVNILDKNEIKYDTTWHNAIYHVLITSPEKDKLLMLMVYGYFEEYVLYENTAALDETPIWNMLNRNELKINNIQDTLKLIGIEADVT